MELHEILYLMCLASLLILPCFLSCLFSHFYKLLVHRRLPGIMTLRLSPLLQCSLSHRCRSCDVNLSVGSGLQSIALHSVWLSFSMIVYFCCKQRFLWPELVATLFCQLECSKGLFSSRKVVALISSLRSVTLLAPRKLARFLTRDAFPIDEALSPISKLLLATDVWVSLLALLWVSCMLLTAMVHCCWVALVTDSLTWLSEQYFLVPWKTYHKK